MRAAIDCAIRRDAPNIHRVAFRARTCEVQAHCTIHIEEARVRWQVGRHTADLHEVLAASAGAETNRVQVERAVFARISAEDRWATRRRDTFLHSQRLDLRVNPDAL